MATFQPSIACAHTLLLEGGLAVCYLCDFGMPCREMARGAGAGSIDHCNMGTIGGQGRVAFYVMVAFRRGRWLDLLGSTVA